jgi:hypothetical protein
MENSDRSCCGGDRCRKLDSGTPVRVAFGGVDAPARSVVSCSPRGSGGSSCGTRTCLWRVRDTKTLICGRSKIICENDELEKKGLGKTIKSYPAEEKKTEGRR